MYLGNFCSCAFFSRRGPKLAEAEGPVKRATSKGDDFLVT